MTRSSELLTRRSVLTASTSALFAHMLPAPASASAGLRSYWRTNWSRDPYAYGSYSYLPKSAVQSDRESLRRPLQERLFFAGEATPDLDNATVHGAYVSGLQATKEIAQTSKTRIAIIGAGISGLAAAQALAETGRKVTVLEARDRIGGRIHSVSHNALTLDVGASWIHGPRGNPLTKLANMANATRLRTGRDYVIRGEGGRKLRDKDVPDWFFEVTETEQEYGADADDLNPRAEDYYSDFGGRDVLFPSGYAEILNALTGEYEVRLETIVEKIDWSQDPAVVTSAGIDTQYDAVLLTVPLGVLKAGNISFLPALPDDKLSAISSLGMGLLDKVFLLYDQAFWDEQTTWILTPETAPARGQFSQWLNLTPVYNQPVIVAFNAASAARQLRALSDDDVIARADQTLRRAYPA